MEIHVQCTDGEMTKFAMTDDWRYLELIESIKPSEFFLQPHLRIHSGKRTLVFNMKTVESIYFATSLMAKIRVQPPARDIRTLSDAEYQENLAALRGRYEQSDILFEPGQSIETLLAIHCMSGAKFFLQVEIIAGLRVEQLMDLHTRMERLTSVIPCSPEGYLAINPSAIKRVEIYPAPPEPMASAWLVE